MQVRVILNDEIVTSFKVCLLVSTFWGIDAIESSTEMNIFDKAVEQATEQFQENAEQIVEEVIESIPADYTELTEEVDELNERIDDIEPGLSDDAKIALLNCFRHVAWIDEHGQDYYDALEEALYANTYPKIVAQLNQTSEIFDTDDLNEIRKYLIVKYFETKESAGETVTTYTLSGSLTIGTSSIVVNYNGLSTIVPVIVTAYYYIPEFAYGGPYATPNEFSYTPNTIRACMNPIVAQLPPGTYSFEFNADSNYYFAPAAIVYDKTQYSPDFSFEEGTRKTFMTSGMSYVYFKNTDGTGGWQNESKQFVVENRYSGVYINLKKGSAGTDNFTATDIQALNGNIVFRRIGA